MNLKNFFKKYWIQIYFIICFTFFVFYFSDSAITYEATCKNETKLFSDYEEYKNYTTICEIKNVLDNINYINEGDINFNNGNK